LLDESQGKKVGERFQPREAGQEKLIACDSLRAQSRSVVVLVSK
jgi:hypothetical protein